MKNFRMAAAAFVIAATSLQACSCEPLVPKPEEGMGGGTATGGGDGMTGGGDGMTGGGTATGGGSGTGGGAATQLTEFARALIVNETNDTAMPRAATEFANLPDDAPITFSPQFFDGGVQ